ncbi:MAG: glycoside hydrolase family 97 catalytic domain-containing protein [Chitinophagaceae bacterium]
MKSQIKVKLHRRCILPGLFTISMVTGFCQKKPVTTESPDKKISVEFMVNGDQSVGYKVMFANSMVLENSSLGLVTSDGDFSQGLAVTSVSNTEPVKDIYKTLNAKKSSITYLANKRVFHLANKSGQQLDIIFQVSNDGIGFRYYFPKASGNVTQILSEATTYTLPATATAFLQPMQESKSGWEKTNPAYEEHYKQDVPVGLYNKRGWVYPALFKTKTAWLLITEAGMDGTYCNTRLYNDSLSNIYHISFPDPREVIGITGGGLLPASKLPWYSPWRIITIGGLNTIMESTLGMDLAAPAKKIDPSFVRPGKASWSWINSKDNFIVYDEQKKYIDFAADMHWQYCLVDADWDRKIGYDKIKELADYAATKNVSLLLWYNSAGDWNTVKYTPKNMLLTSELRSREFARLQAMGIKGVKIDFFGGDGQSVIKYYTDILEDAAKYKLLVNFHGATLPRGWARTYPQLMTTEAVRGFEMITFNQADADLEASHCAMLPYARNAFDPMDFTPMNLYKIQTKVQRKTTSAFELALSVLFLSGIQHYAESPEGMIQVPGAVKDFLRQLPNNWDDAKFIDGYPGKLLVMARKSGKKWYVAGINGEAETRQLDLDLAFLKGKKATLISDGAEPLSFKNEMVTIANNGKYQVEIKGAGGFVLLFE